MEKGKLPKTTVFFRLEDVLNKKESRTDRLAADPPISLWQWLRRGVVLVHDRFGGILGGLGKGGREEPPPTRPKGLSCVTTFLC